MVWSVYYKTMITIDKFAPKASKKIFFEFALTQTKLTMFSIGNCGIKKMVEVGVVKMWDAATTFAPHVIGSSTACMLLWSY